MWSFKRNSVNWKLHKLLLKILTLRQSCEIEEGEERKQTEEIFLWEVGFFDHPVDSTCLYSATLRYWALLVYMYSFSLKRDLLFCLKPRGLTQYFSWWRRIWGSKWLMQANMCCFTWGSLKYAFKVPDVWQWGKEDRAQCYFFSFWYWNAELTFLVLIHPHRFTALCLSLKGTTFHLEVSGDGRVPHNYPKAGVSNEELLGKDDLTQNIHLHLHVF